MAGKEVDKSVADELLTHAKDLKSSHGDRVADLQEYEDAFLLKWDEGNSRSLNNLRTVVSTEARQSVLGAWRLMAATDPVIKVENVSSEMFDAEPIERSLNRWLQQNGRIARRPFHYDMLLSGLLYGEMHTAINSTDVMLKRSVHRARWERVANRVPYLAESWNPKECWPEFDSIGLTAHLREVSMSLSQVRETYGDDAVARLKNVSSSHKVSVRTFYDLDYYCVWVEDVPIILEQHGLSCIPIDVTQIDGSRLFGDQDDQRQPLLYSLIKSGLWSSQNVALSVLFTVVFGMGISPMFAHTAPTSNPQKRLQMDFSGMPGVFELEPSERVEPMGNKGLIDPALQQVYQLAEQKGEEVTLYKQALGAPPSHAQTFSQTSILGQAGRLPLIGSQRMGGSGIAGLLETVLIVMKDDGASFKKNGIELSGGMYDDGLEISANLDVRLPQDKLQMANIANLVKSQGLADDTWIQENLLMISDTERMRGKIWAQRAYEALFADRIQAELETIKQARAMAMQVKQQMGSGGPQQPRDGQSGPQDPGVPFPPQSPNVNPNMAQEFDPSMGGAQPQMAQGQELVGQGGLPPQMAGMMPSSPQEV